MNNDFENVESGKKEVFPEDFPEGPYGSPMNKKLGKTSTWQKDQRSVSAYTYENKNLHENLPRQHPGAHPTHDDPNS